MGRVSSTDVQGFGVLQGSGEPALRAGEGVGPGQACAARVAMADDSEQPVPWVCGVSTRRPEPRAHRWRRRWHPGTVGRPGAALEEDRGAGRCGELFGLGDRGVPCHRDGFAHQYREFGEVGG